MHRFGARAAMALVNPPPTCRNQITPLWPSTTTLLCLNDTEYPLLLLERPPLIHRRRLAYFLDLDSHRPPEIIHEAGFVIPGATTDRLWLVGHDTSWIVAVDTATGVAGSPIEVTGFVDRFLVGVANGLIVTPVVSAIEGQVAYWSPAIGLQPLGLANSENARLLTASGDIAAFVSGDATIQIMDVARRQLVGEFSIDAENRIVDGCLSPNSFLAILDAAGKVTVVASDGTVLQNTVVAQQQHGFAWTASDQLLLISDTTGGRRLHAIDVFTGTERDIVSLYGAPDWIVAAAGSTC